MLGARQLDDGRKCFLPLLILALLLFPGLALSALLLFPGLAFFAFFLALLLVFAFTRCFSARCNSPRASRAARSLVRMTASTICLSLATSMPCFWAMSGR